MMNSATFVADILAPVALDTAYSYAVPPGLELKVGDVVAMPLGPRETIGVVWALREGHGGNFKKVSGKLGVPPLPETLRRLVDWVARYTLCPRGAVLAMALKLPGDERPDTPKIGVRLAGHGAPPRRMTPARARVIAQAQGGLVQGKAALARAAGVSVGVLDGLIDEGTLETVPLAPEPVARLPDPGHAMATLSPEQTAAAEVLRAAVSERAFAPILLEGVTGSGKTEVYFEAVAEALREGRQSVILMPEIALTAQFLDRFAARFGEKPAVWHSGVSGRRRERLFAAIVAGEAKVVAGARSALFLPYRDLGLIVVDEEHEAAYKQEDGVPYHARDMAVKRAELEKLPVLLASATPSVETKVNAQLGRYRHLELPQRFGGRHLPDIRAIDLRTAAPESGHYLAPPLVKAMGEAMERGEQALLFLNRRGYAPLTVCRSCGHRYKCVQCSAWLVEHRFRRALVCHHCGHTERRPDACTQCGTVDSLVACGPGVERLAEEVKELFPHKRAIVLSSDFPGGTERLREQLAAIAAGEADIVVGTQLVAKGHNFPQLTCVGVVDADLGLAGADPRAAERTFQVLQQVAGRAGRGEKPGRAYLQTYQPDHPVIKALLCGDTERFYAQEIEMREAAGLPPFGRLAALIVSGPDRAATEAHARALGRAAQPPDNVAVLGPAEAPIAMIRGRHRMRLLVKTARNVDVQSYIRSWLARGPRARGGLKVQVDIDPQSFL